MDMIVNEILKQKYVFCKRIWYLNFIKSDFIWNRDRFYKSEFYMITVL